MAVSELGAFLHARRATVRPEDVGMRPYGHRRVGGLRREVAVLAGLSADYYTRLEQGRERNPSPQVLDALCRALKMDDDQQAHLYRLADLAPRSGSTATREWVSPALLQLMDHYTATPAFVINRALDILAANAIAQALFAPFTHAGNLACMAFVDPAGRSFFAQWHRAAQTTVAHLRLATGHDPHDRRLRQLVAELIAASPVFRR